MEKMVCKYIFGYAWGNPANFPSHIHLYRKTPLRVDTGRGCGFNCGHGDPPSVASPTPPLEEVVDHVLPDGRDGNIDYTTHVVALGV
ncbi:hypothetical protein GH714_035819 [Hevea brasiliensis]|uniref:Uncharacterized protein n=1 Tax=Hevea brasiliensis TaxID=3981 RepID=A0A6A6KDS6_HEVBR|nr:hypothetical protein GH714_035819 [Hevea brasiliensis]